MSNPDRINYTARQVRCFNRGPVHSLVATFTSQDAGNSYVTGCGKTLTVGGAAVLTTWPVTCRSCLAGGH